MSVERKKSAIVLKKTVIPHLFAVLLAFIPVAALAEGENFPDIKGEIATLNQDQPKDWVAYTQSQIEKAEQERKELEYWSLGQNTLPQIKQWENIILSCSRKYNLNPRVVAALMMVESQGDRWAKSRAGAIGLMQVMGGPWDPELNIDQGCKLLAWGLQKFDGKLDLALASYNAGPHRVEQYGGVPPYKETQKHIELTFHYMAEFDARGAGK